MSEPASCTSGDRPTIRLARPTDSIAIARLHVAAWQVAYHGLLPEHYLDGLSDSEWEKTWAMRLSKPEVKAAVLVAEEHGAILGFANVGPGRDPDTTLRTGEIRSIYLHPHSQRRGLGTRLHDHAMQALARHGFRHATLWVLASNRPARSFYEKLAWTVDGHTKIDHRADVVMPQVRYERWV